MRKFTTEHTVYDFDELSDAAKEKAIDQQREFVNESTGDWLPDDLSYKLEELLKQHKITYSELPKVYYSLNYTQGDGAMFEGIVEWRRYRATITHEGMYYHYNSKDIELLTKTGNGVALQTIKTFNDLYVSICQELERYGYDCLDQALADENLVEDIKANGYEFYEDGRIA